MTRRRRENDASGGSSRWAAPLVATLAALLAASAAAAPVVIGHRGNSSIAPENTLAAIDAAVGSAWGVESDPRITLDNQVILMHDATVDRTTDGTGAVANMTFAEIRALDAGSKFSPEFAGEQVPTMLEAVQLAQSYGMISCLDIKSYTPYASRAQQYVDLLTPYKDSIEIHCFGWDFLAAVEAIAPGQFTLVALGSGDIASTLPTLPAGVDKLSWQNTSALTASGIAAAHAAGIQVYAWTVDDPTAMLSLCDMGIDGIVTNNTILANALLSANPQELGDGLPRRLHDGLMMNWTFDDGLSNPSSTVAADSVRGLDATLLSGIQWRSGSAAKLGGAIELDGTNDYATIPVTPETLPLTSPLTNAVTISTWVKFDRLPSASAGSYQSILDSAEDAYVLYVDKSAKELRFKVTAGTAARPGIPEAALDTTDWHHVVAVYDGGAGVARIYLDGQLIDMHAGDSVDALTGIVGSQTMFFGRNGATATNSWLDGRIDDTAVWSRALGQTEIQHLYNGGAGRAVLESNALVPVATPVVRLAFEKNLQNLGSGGSAYNGALVNGASGTTAYVPGPRGTALAFDNPQSPTGGDSVNIPYTLGSAGTIAFWCSPNELYDNQTIFDAASAANQWEMLLYGGAETAFWLSSSTYVFCDLDDVASADNWYHMAVSWFRTGSTVVLNYYVDGVLRDVALGDWADPGTALRLAGGLGQNYGNLGLDDFRVYDTVLATDEIVTMFLGRELPGDANGDLVVDALDAAALAAHWLSADNPGWSGGDFNGDGIVDDLDASILAAHWQYSAAATSVPEPGTAAGAICGLTTLLFLTTRRRQRRLGPSLG